MTFRTGALLLRSAEIASSHASALSVEELTLESETWATLLISNLSSPAAHSHSYIMASPEKDLLSLDLSNTWALVSRALTKGFDYSFHRFVGEDSAA
jgi:hypothetical protein